MEALSIPNFDRWHLLKYATIRRIQQGSSKFIIFMVDSRLHILCAHQGSELYGSDRVFVEAVRTFRRLYPESVITVLLPTRGPIVDLLDECQCRIIYDKLWILRRYDFFGSIFKAPFKFPKQLIDGYLIARTADIVYVSTVVVISHLVLARFHDRAIVHVHEIPDFLPKVVLKRLVSFAKANTIFNSLASREAFALPHLNSKVVYNGFKPVAPPKYSNCNEHDPVNLLVIGRLSIGKGQDLLIKALAALPSTMRKRVRLKIVGDAYGTNKYRLKLERLAARYKLENVVFLPFVVEPSSLYLWSDIVVVPSRVIESFGLVAVEAMAYGKCVIASAQGGLKEIVADRVTGRLFKQNDVRDLEEALYEVFRSPGLIRARGKAGYVRFHEQFGSAKFETAMAEFITASFGSSDFHHKTR